MFRVIYSGNALPYSFLVDPNAEFEAGMVGELKVFGSNQIVCGVSGGKNPIGIIDDYKTNSFSRAVIDEVVIVPVDNPVEIGGKLVTSQEIIAELENPLILPQSFVSAPVDGVLNATNGNFHFLAGTELNYSQTNSGIPDSIRTVVRYSHQVANVIGENTTADTGQVTIWIQPGTIFQTDVYDTSQQYPLNTLLYCGLDGKLTAAKIDADFPAVAMVTGCPTSIYGALEAKWLI